MKIEQSAAFVSFSLAAAALLASGAQAFQMMSTPTPSSSPSPSSTSAPTTSLITNPTSFVLSRRSLVTRSFSAAATGLVAGSGLITPTSNPSSSRRASAALSASSSSELPDEAYTTIGGDLKSCRILNGMWQLSGGHGYRVQKAPAVSDMRKYYEAGYNTFDAADIYGPAEEVIGAYHREFGNKNQGLFYTKWVPRPERISRAQAKEAIGRSLQKMDVTQLDMVQFHWWEYGYSYYMDALQYLQEIKEDGGIRHLALTNFDTKHMAQIYDDGIPIVSNQVQYSILDQRPGAKMAAEATKRGISIFGYGTLLGGFFSEKWLGQPEPKSFETVSQQKYYNMIRTWGDWKLFQELLVSLDTVAKKHKVSIPNVAVRWVLEQPAVGGAIVGVRFGLPGKEHLDDNRRVFEFALDEEDKAGILAVTEKAQDLMKRIGDSGDEYRRA